MASRRKSSGEATSGRWQQRLAARELRVGLEAAIEKELRHVAGLKLEELVEPEAVHGWIDAFDTAAIDEKHLTDLIAAASDAIAGVLRESKRCGSELLGAHAGAQIETLLFDTDGASEGLEDLITSLMHQEFTRQLFTEIVFTSIVSFNKKVNPFGGFAMRAMEDQIKGFIRLFMPMIQSQAAAFAVDNQAAVLELTRKLIGEALQRPLAEQVRDPSAKRRAAGTALLRHALKNTQLEKLSRDAAHAAWDAIWAKAGKLTVGALVHLDKHAQALANGLVEVILPWLAHPPLLEWIAGEIAAGSEEEATAAVAPTRPRRRKK